MPTTNNDFDWLTYESVFNKPDFRKSNKRYDAGLYLIPRDKVTVWFRDDIDAELLTKLTDAFFPDFESEKHRKYSDSIWIWKETADAGTIEEAISPVGIMANRNKNVINLSPDVILPYNFYDNSSGSNALGTNENAGSVKLIQLKSENKWGFWKTASRSNVVRLERIKDKGASWDDKKKPAWETWSFSTGDVDRNNPASLLKDIEEPTRYKLGTFTKYDVSLKTGVIYVGSKDQSGSNKDYLDDNWIVAALRSDYVATINKEMEGKRHEDSRKQDILVLTELLSINETEMRVKGKYKDGVQIRDISPLTKENIYFAPLNIPFVNLEFNVFQEEFACLADKVWCDYWKKHWAVSLGTAKALFLLRYGLQHVNPNVQNYMIEFKKGIGGKPEPTGRIVIRDLQDAALHREVVWALYGPKGEAPPEGRDKKDVLGNKLTLKLLKYEFKEVESYQETGSTDSQFGPAGTQFLWQRFSAFGNGDKILKLKDEEPFKSKWKDILATMANWGKSHNRAYVGCIEHQLGINFIDIKWQEISDPESYRTLGNINDASSKCLVSAYKVSESTGLNPPVVDFISSSNFPYSDKNWETVFGNAVPVEKKYINAPCVLIKGDKFQHPKLKIDEIEDHEKVLISKDGKSLYIKTKELETRNLVTNKKAIVTVINHEKEGDTKPTGVVIYEPASIGGDMGWEENAAKVVHDYLKSPEGQQAIRDYKARGWQPVAPKFRLQILDEYNKPIENILMRVIFKGIAKRMIGLTDSNGEVQVYKYSPEECMVRTEYNSDGSYEVKDLIGLKESTLDLTGNKEGIKIKYLK